MNDDKLRHVLEQTLLAAKKEQNSTGFIAVGDKIPLYDNFLFCLALFRSKTHENLLEAKRLLERLLYFQQNFPDVPWYGNFPLYLSDFPYCADHLQSFRILTVATWIQQEFSQVLGYELKGRLDAAIQLLASFSVQIDREIKIPFWAKVKLAALQQSPELLPDLADTSDLRTWGDPNQLAEMLTAYQLMPVDAFKPFWDYLASSWHVPSGAFIGPAFSLGKQSVNLNIAMGLITDKLPKVDTWPLFCSLLRLRHAFTAKSYPYAVQVSHERFSWSLCQNEKYGFCQLFGQPNPEQMPGFYSYHLVYGPHSLAIQAPFGTMSRDLVFEIPFEDKPKALCIWFNNHKNNEVYVANSKATCFELTDPLEIFLADLRLVLRFTLETAVGPRQKAQDFESESVVMGAEHSQTVKAAPITTDSGSKDYAFRPAPTAVSRVTTLTPQNLFVGHIIRGARSGASLPQDVEIFLRPLRISGPSTLQVHLEIKENLHAIT